jgi:uncharacterized protein YgbK (DUF1537 family)
MLLGCIGDDFTGSSDLANTLSKQGMRVIQYTGTPRAIAASDIEAGVVALKSRSIRRVDAVRQSLDALRWLRDQGCRQYFFKYCSTFDSTPKGNIGPVAEALADELGTGTVIVCPAFPGAGRTVYQGHLFVNDRLLSESGMERHPLNPMTDPDLRRWLARQASGAVGHVPARWLFEGWKAVRAALDEESASGRRLIVVDALRDEDLLAIGRAACDLPLVTGGSGVAMGLPQNFRERGLLSDQERTWRGEGGRCAAISGSCSKATLRQIAIHAKTDPAREIPANEVMTGQLTEKSVAQWMLEQSGTPLAYSSAGPDAVLWAQSEFGRELVSARLESFFAELAQFLRIGGVQRLIVAGGETSGAVVERLGLAELEIGPEISTGVPALRAGPGFVLALKSGNFGADGFFNEAAAVLKNGAQS